MREKSLQQISSGIDRATHLAEELLRLARLDPRQGLDHPEAVSLPAVIEEAITALTSVLAGGSRQIYVVPAEAGLVVHGEAELLRIAVRNLLDNALRYTRPGDDIWVELQSMGGRVAISVRDSGLGLAIVAPKLRATRPPGSPCRFRRW